MKLDAVVKRSVGAQGSGGGVNPGAAAFGENDEVGDGDGRVDLVELNGEVTQSGGKIGEDLSVGGIRSKS